MGRIFRSPYPPVDVPTNLSISQFLEQSNPDDVDADKLVVSDFDGPSEALTFGGLRSKAAKCAYGLRRELGLAPGDTVCIIAGNSVNWIVLTHAVMWAGGCFSAVNPVATSYELIHYLQIAEPTIIAVDHSALKTVEAALKSLSLPTQPKLILIADGSGSVDSEQIPLFPRDFLHGDTPALDAFDLSGQDNRNVPAAMCFSSGTSSGQPKGVLHSHYGLIAYLLTLRSTNPFAHCSQTSEVFFPSFAHVYGIVAGLLMPAYVGSYLVAMKTFNFIEYLQKAAEIRATMLRLVPTTVVRMVKDQDVRRLDLSSVNTVMCSGATLASEVVTELQRMLHGTTILNGYGMTEGTISLLREAWSEKKAGSVGKPAAGVAVRVIDDDYNDVPVGTDGECLFRSPTLFMGYKNNRAEAEASFRDGWFCSGDVVRMDEDGFLWITGRKKELIKYKAYQVPPAELEAVMLSHPKVTDAGVCGVYDPSIESEVAVGYVSLVSNIGLGDEAQVLADVKQLVKETLAPYKQLRSLHCLDEMPKNSNGKLLRRELPAKKEELRSSKL